MPSEIYEVVAQGARYWFVFLMAIIVWRSYRWLARDRKQRKKRLRLLPDAGYVGEMVVQTGGEKLPVGAVFPVPNEGVLGTLRSCDLCVLVSGVGKRHLWFRYEDGEGLMVKTFGGRRANVDGEEIVGNRKQAYMAHGSRLRVGDAVLRLRMFAGFETVARAQTTAFVAEEEQPGPQTEASDSRESAAMTPEQLALWQQQQWQIQMWQLAQQAVAVQAAMAGAGGNHEDEEGDYDDEEDVEEGVGAVPRAASQGYVVLTDDGIAPAWEEEPKRSRLFSPFAPLESEEVAEEPFRQLDFEPAGMFYPPVADDAAEEEWPYAPYPQSDAVFESHGYTYPEYVESTEEDEDLTDAAAPPKSLYVEPDEAEKAKRLLWDKYFGGGRKR